MEDRKYKTIYEVKKKLGSLDVGNIVAIISDDVVPAPPLENYSKSAILVVADIFQDEDGKLIRYNSFSPHHSSSMFAEFILSLRKLSDDEVAEFYRRDKVFIDVSGKG